MRNVTHCYACFAGTKCCLTGCQTKTLTFKPLAVDEKKSLFVFINKRAEAIWKQIRKELGRHDGEVFNFEDKKRSKLKGNTTNGELLKRLGDGWSKLSEKLQDDLVVDLYTIEDEGVLIRRLRKVWKFSEKQAEELSMKVRLEEGYSRLSAKALKKIWPSPSAGKNYHDACQEGGYKRQYQTVSAGVDLLPLPPQLRNPVVQKAFYQVRRVVNALIKKHGKPAEICIEMARDMKLSKKEKESLEQRHADNEKGNQRAVNFLKEHGIAAPNRDNIVKYKLWLECKQRCPSTDVPIPIDRLFVGDFQVEHIFPWSRTFDDSFANKTLCAASRNQHVKMN
ncbi:MAG: hypothetical protein LBD30_06760 [Verrucomicrobiales bacterium]|jgi:CRISPR-associated endonuclease Csn1|nr:hypothetical protein [Verrucomicrobiales bacterium]